MVSSDNTMFSADNTLVSADNINTAEILKKTIWEKLQYICAIVMYNLSINSYHKDCMELFNFLGGSDDGRSRLRGVPAGVKKDFKKYRAGGATTYILVTALAPAPGPAF
jgi:hypothetical protein